MGYGFYEEGFGASRFEADSGRPRRRAGPHAVESRMSGKRPAHRPPKYPGEEMTSLTVRLPVRLKGKLLRVSGGRTGEWVCDRIEKARERETRLNDLVTTNQE